MKKYLALGFAAALAGIFAIAPIAQADQESILRNERAAGSMGGANAPHPVIPMGTVYEILATATGIAGTGEQTLGTFTLPAGALDIAGRHLRITANFAHAANTNNVTPKLYFGSEALATALGATSGQAFKLQCDVLKTGASTQQVNCWGLGGVAGVVPVTNSQTGAETDTAGIVIKATCTGGTTGADCTLSDFYVEILN